LEKFGIIGQQRDSRSANRRRTSILGDQPQVDLAPFPGATLYNRNGMNRVPDIRVLSQKNP
jgi:hypothetical protein